MARLLAIVMALGSCSLAGAVVEIFFTSSSSPYGLSDPNLAFTESLWNGGDMYSYALLDPNALPPFETPTIDPANNEWLYIWLRFQNAPTGAMVQGLELVVQPVTQVQQVAYYVMDNTALWPEARRWNGNPGQFSINPVILAAVTTWGLRSAGTPPDWETLWVGNWPSRTYLLGAVRVGPGQNVVQLELGPLGIQYAGGTEPPTTLGVAHVVNPPCNCDCPWLPDCNGNGRNDTCDLADGTSADCNANDLPDECEEPTDLGFGTTHYANADFTGDKRVVVQPAVTQPPAFDSRSVRVRTWLHTPLVSGTYQFWLSGRPPLRIGGVTYDWQPYPDYYTIELRGDTWYEVTYDYSGRLLEPQVFQWKLPGAAHFSNIPATAIAAGRDCNGNGVLDDCDINTGTSFDVNGNAAPDECDFCLGDVNCDGIVNCEDVDPFVAALSHPGGVGWTAACDWLSADANHDGQVTFADIDPFVARLGTTCPALPR